MPTFDTPEPISVTVDLGVGDIRVAASDRTDTTVEVRPSNPGKKADVTAAEQTRVEYANGRLLIKAPKGWRQWAPWGGHESVDVQITVPAGSQLRADAGLSAVRCTGRLGDVRVKTGLGDIQLDQAGPVQVSTGGGDVTADHVAGHAEISTSTGRVQVGTIDGTAVIKKSNGDTWIGEVTGDLRVVTSNGDITAEAANASVVAKTANGDVRLGEVARGAIVAQTGHGDLHVGIRNGVAAWLDLDTHYGHVHNGLESAGPPAAGDDTVEVRARSSYGDITIHRS
jgi:Putative adhesin